MHYYLDTAGLQNFAQKLTAKNKTLFAEKSLEIDVEELRAAVGSPLVASTAADMTDTDKIYVYVGSEEGYTAGDWYYYDGSDWQDGGVYNSTALVTDTTLSVAGEAADAKAVGDADSELNDAIEAVYDVMPTNTTTTTDTVVATAGKFWNPSSNPVALSEITGRAYVEAIPILPGDSLTVTGWATSSSYYYLVLIVDASYNLLWHSASVESSQSVTITKTAPANAAYMLLSTPSTSTQAKTVSYTVVHTELADLDDFVDVKIENSEKHCSFVFYTPSSADATGAINVYIPSKVGYIRYNLYHSVKASYNADVWRMYKAIAVTDARSVRYDLTVGGEWECALHLKDRDDFMGGVTHGDEVATETQFFVDGKTVADISTYTMLTKFTELRLVRTSNLYDPADHTTVVAKHGCEYIFTADGLVINQTVKWLSDVTVTNCYMAMHLPNKRSSSITITDKYYNDADIDVTPYPADDYNLTVNDAKSCAVFGDKVYTYFEIGQYPTGYEGGDCLLLTDNGGLAYNKCYFPISLSVNGISIPANTIWKTTTRYKFEVGG